MAPPSLMQSLGPVLMVPGMTESPTSDVITGESGFLGLYFSAQWAPSCRAITDQLEKLCLDRDKGPIKIVLVSSDEDEASFGRFLGELPADWKAVPFSDIRRRLRLLRQHRVQSLPFLVLLNCRTGRSVSRISSETLLKDPYCARFPWERRPLREILTNVEIVDPCGRSVDYEQLKESLKALYFSANWCPPCKAFTPQLVHTYNAIKKKGHKFEVLFVSSDRSEESWKAYHNSMPWPGIQWKEQEVREELAESLDIKGIPTLVILDSDLSVISKEGRNLVNEDPEAEDFPWCSSSVEFLKEFHMPFILERPTLVLFTDGEPSELQFGKDVLLPAAEEYFSEHSNEAGMSLQFFVAGEDEISEGLRELANLDDVVPLLAIIDLAEGSKYLLENGVEISNAAVHNFVSRYTNEELSPIPLTQEETDDRIYEEEEEVEENERKDENEEEKGDNRKPVEEKHLEELTSAATS